jgi:hypothetical protein
MSVVNEICGDPQMAGKDRPVLERLTNYKFKTLQAAEDATYNIACHWTRPSAIYDIISINKMED